MEKNETQCEMCKDRQWISLQMNPLDRASDLVAPCLGCSGDKKLANIEKERGIKLIRDTGTGQWTEQTIN